MSRQAQHGPGPWRKQSGTTFISVIDANEHPILFNASPEAGVPREEHEANADLITAAPDLLAAIELATIYLEDGAPNTALRVLRDAHAKAKGEA